MDKIREWLEKFNDLIAVVKLQKMAQDSELLKDVYGKILTYTFNKRKENI